ncbi:agamous-like MADS-box protein AGL80 [Telopea speciosissima]|uniref:agamous-like MADS-box protein AGL80 n=1 Tax=Telopea speciosissima TaxID=54955 RepID=UPI001CC4BB6D|nr:agamous-like MADS-box protein AGL80 [Telopea speciosissima]
MPWRKIKLAFIQNDAARKIAYKQRKRGIMKKVKKLSTLCDVAACAIVYGPYDPNSEVWPSPSEAKSVLEQFRSFTEMGRYNKMVNQEEFLIEKIAKLKEKLNKQVRENQEKEKTKLMFECLLGQKDLNDLSLETLGDLEWFVNSKMEVIQDRIQLLNSSPPVVVVVAATRDEVNSGGGDQVEAMEAVHAGKQPWFLDLNLKL